MTLTTNPDPNADAVSGEAKNMGGSRLRVLSRAHHSGYAAKASLLCERQFGRLCVRRPIMLACGVVLALVAGCTSSASGGGDDRSSVSGVSGPPSAYSSQDVRASSTDAIGPSSATRLGQHGGSSARAKSSAISSPATQGTGTSIPTVPVPPRATTPVPAPSGGDVRETVSTGSVSTQPAVALTGVATYGNGVSVLLETVQKVNTEAQLPGEVGGPGVELIVVIRNASKDAIDLDNVVVDLQDASTIPATPMSASPARPVSGSLAAGRSLKGIYVFSFPPNYREPSHLSVRYSSLVPVVLFAGTIS